MGKKTFFSKRNTFGHYAPYLVLFLGGCVFVYALLFPFYRVIDYLIALFISFFATGLFYWFLS
ncbi:MAG: hypothetical protein GX786_03300, partial [Clostridiales bacterium]|nr:hypothetical protein [Clostridiales bacterium]